MVPVAGSGSEKCGAEVPNASMVDSMAMSARLASSTHKPWRSADARPCQQYVKAIDTSHSQNDDLLERGRITLWTVSSG